MVKKILIVAASLIAVLFALGFMLYVTNPAPAVPAVAAPDLADPSRPFVVKVHAQWCPVCMTTKGVWTEIEAAYAGRVNLAVFDFTNQASTDASSAEARRLGLEKVFAENDGWTGTILVVDGRSREVTAAIHGSRDFAEYRAAIDAALASTASPAIPRSSTLP